MKKGLLSLMLIGAVLVVAVTSGSVAYFSDTEVSSGNEFTAGTLDLKVWDANNSIWTDDPYTPAVISCGYWDSGIGALINNLKPGDTGTVTVPLRNDGSVDGEAKIQLLNLVDWENGVNEPECVAEGGIWLVPDPQTEGTCTNCSSCGDPGPNQGELSPYLNVVIYYDGVQKATGTLYDVFSAGVIELDVLAAYEEKDIVMEFSIDYQLAGNIIQSDSVAFDVAFELIQPEP